MASDRTFVTELATGLGMCGAPDVASVMATRPEAMVNLDDDHWDRLVELWRSGAHAAELHAGFRNGRAFLEAPDALAGRRPRIVEWTGGRRPPGDEVVPSDLRVDHVYLVSCKYLSRILHNPSPARLVEGMLLAGARSPDSRDWYERVAPGEHQRLYETCAESLDVTDLPAAVGELTPVQRRQLARALASGWPPGATAAYARLCRAVTDATVERWQTHLADHDPEVVLWRLLRIGSAPYFILGASSRGSMRLRIDTPWDWRQAFRLRRFAVTPEHGGQPRMRWAATYTVRATGEERLVRGHVEIRWSHGRFGQPPEAKVYLDTRHEAVPGYHPL